ncbi:MAG: hypothetical protein R3236_00780 [Phycisphaeraceae bacterium]|nr:hypothetical protein [Phycisphaeraceae bacterium]
MTRAVAGLMVALGGAFGCQITGGQTTAGSEVRPSLRFVSYGRRQLSPEGWLFVQARHRLRNDTGQTIWVSQSLWHRPSYEPAAAPRFGGERTIEPMRPLADGQSVLFYEWMIKDKPRALRCWYRLSPRGKLHELKGPVLKP